MRALAWDTSSKTGAIVALEWAEGCEWPGVRLVSEWSLSVDAQHSERLLWGIHQTLEASRWKLSDVDLLGVGVGPGSFTGLRIGMTTARTLAHTLKKPLIGISSLEALARPAALALEAMGEGKATLIASTDACKGELFAFWGPASLMAAARKKSGSLDVYTPDDLMKRVLKKKPQRWAAIGEGASRYPEAWKALPAKGRLEIELPFHDQVQGRYLGMLLWEAHRNHPAQDALEVHPVYLRSSDAELKLKAGLLPKVAVREPVL
jgi:tRNA threonylcarbamoyladenosine biosynthesis protein TsaB